jgi:hypothetical protein
MLDRARPPCGRRTFLHPVLDQIDMIESARTSAFITQTVRPVTVRPLDAIHLGTALDIQRGLTSFVTYDKRLLEAAAGASRLPHLTPPPAK